MKRIALVLVLVLVMGMAMGQQVVNGVYQGSPSSFMYLTPQTGGTSTNWNDSWVKPKRYSDGDDFITPYSTNQPNMGSNATMGAVTTGATSFSHRFVVSNNMLDGHSNDPCFRQTQALNYQQRPTMASSWNSDLYNDSRYVDTVIQMGGSTTSRGKNAQEILYSFIPDTNNPVLLLQFAFVTENALHSNYAPRNPGVEFAVLSHNTPNYLPLGNYPGTNKPYSQFFFGTPLGEGASGDDPRNTPSTSEPYLVPKEGSGCSCNQPNMYTFPYVIVAFNLSEQARNHQAVDFRVREWACNASVHWAYCYFTAKMIPAKLKVEYCGGDTLKLNIPWGFDENGDISYKWFNGTDENHCSRIYPDDYEDSRVIAGSTNYHPLLIPNPEKPYYRCEVVSYTGVPFTYEATVKYYDLKPQFWAEPRAISDSVHKCGYSVLVHNESKIGIMQPNGNGGVDTVWENLSVRPEQCSWNFGDDTLQYHGFEPEHVYADTGTYIITLTITDNERVCISTEYYDTVRIVKEFKEKHYSRDTVVTCESKLPYYYKPELFGREDPRTIWNLNNAEEDSILVNYSWVTRDTIRSWNGCDSIVKVKFDVLTPVVLIQEAAGSDFCDSAQTRLETRVDNVSRTPVYEWTFMDSIIGTGSTLLAMSDGVYSVTIEDTTTGCTAATSYKINPCVPNVYLPNCITPTTKAAEEGPVQNNYFYLDEFVLRFISEVKFMVYSRDGQQVYYYEGKKNPDGKFTPPTPFGNLPSEMDNRLVLWDGSVHGRIVDGTYTYALWIVSGGKSYLYKGRLMVM
jgi:hypothetical protein